MIFPSSKKSTDGCWGSEKAKCSVGPLSLLCKRESRRSFCKLGFWESERKAHLNVIMPNGGKKTDPFFVRFFPLFSFLTCFKFYSPITTICSPISKQGIRKKKAAVILPSCSWKARDIFNLHYKAGEIEPKSGGKFLRSMKCFQFFFNQNGGNSLASLWWWWSDFQFKTIFRVGLVVKMSPYYTQRYLKKTANWKQLSISTEF